MISDTKSSLQLTLLNQLRIINNIKFTHRELDIISFFICGRSAKKIAAFFSISPKTVENHVHNIMVKLGCNSKEYIIDFIEKSHKLSLFRKYYGTLLVEAIFEKSLRDVSKAWEGKEFSCIIVNSLDRPFVKEMLGYVEHSLKSSGVIVSMEEDPSGNFEPFLQKNRYVLYFGRKEEASQGAVRNSSSSEGELASLFLFSPQSSAPLELCQDIETQRENGFEGMDLHQLVFAILKKMLPTPALESIQKDFTDRLASLHQDAEEEGALLPPLEATQTNTKAIGNFFFLQKNKRLFLLGCVGLGLCTVVFAKIQKNERASSFVPFQKHLLRGEESPSPIRSDLVLPTGTLLLDRSDLLLQIDKKFQGGGKIKTVALVGIGGAGKTTLARRYAATQPTSCVWEINSESETTLAESFEDLAQALSKTEEDSKALAGILKLKDSAQREEKLISFVRGHLKTCPEWILIYDNVEKFADIQNYFPKDPAQWGRGKVLLTSRDRNIENNNYINNILAVGELSAADKFGLFMRIMENGSPVVLNPAQREEIQRFLAEIPPFPLDVSISAYYIKATHTPYESYLRKFRTYDHEFSKMQEKILREAGECSQTRYNIITLSLHQLLKLNPDYKDFLLLTSLLNPVEIQKDRLLEVGEENLVDSFIVHMKRYSLISHKKTGKGPSSPTFSIHRSTQKIILSYLTERENLKRNDPSIKRVADSLERAMNLAVTKEDFSSMKILAGHAEHFLNAPLLTEFSKRGISGELGCIYYYLCHYSQAKQLLSSAVADLSKNLAPNAEKIASFLVYLANVHRRLGEYNKAIDLFKQSIALYERVPGSPLGRAKACGYLGIVYEALGLFGKAKILLEESLALYQKHATNQIGHAWALAHLASVYKSMGGYAKAQDLYEQSLTIYKQFSPSYVGTAWVCKDLGYVYMALGAYEKANALLKESLAIYKEHFSEDQVYVAYALVGLGTLYGKMQHFTEAKSLLQKGLLGVKRTYGEGHVEIGCILKELGAISLAEGDIKGAETFADSALSIYQKANHPEKYEVLELLAEVYEKKSQMALQEGKREDFKKLRDKAHQALQEALKTLKTFLPQESPHTVRICNKIKREEDSRKKLLESKYE